MEDLTLMQLAGTADLPLLVVGPSLGTSVAVLWDASAKLLGNRFHVVGWDLPGHGRGNATVEPLSVAALAAAVVDAVDRTLGGVRFGYAGDSVGGAVGLQLALDVPERLTGVVAICGGAGIGKAESWDERAALVRGSGTAALVETAAARWFGTGFLERQPGTATALLGSLQHADAESYALVCDALARFDLRDRLDQIAVRVLAIAGEEDVVVPPSALREQAAHIPGARFVELDGVGHLAPAESPSTVAGLVAAHLERDPAPSGTAVRRQVLGGSHIERATADTSDVTRDFQDLITRYAWGEIWTRPGLARRDRSIAVLTALVAGRHFDELEFHLQAALANGLTREEIVEVLLQAAVYVGVPAANSAFAVAARVLGEED